MAKTPRLKTRNVSKHSRAARRAASPPNATLAAQVDDAGEIRHHKNVQHYAGVSKKRAKGRPLTRSQRLRREKGMERAEAVIDQLEIKKSHSLGRGKQVKDRAADWEKLNGKILKGSKAQGGSFGALAGDDAEGWEDEEEDENDAGMNQDAVQEREAIKAVTALQVSAEGSGGGEVTAAMADPLDEDEVL